MGVTVRYRDLLARPEFASLTVAQIVSGLGDQVARIAVALLVLDRTGSASLSAAAFAVAYVPLVFGGTSLGPIADRFPRRAVLLTSDAARAILLGLLALFASTGAPTLALLALLLVAEVITPVFDAAWTATLTEVLPDGAQYLAGSGLLRTLHLLQQVAGLAVGGLLVAVLQVQGALLLDAFTFAASFALLAAFLKRRSLPTGDRPTGRWAQQVREGFSDVFADPARRTLVLAGWGSAVVMIAPMAVALPYAEQVAGDAALGGILMAATVGGAAVGSVLIARRDPQWQIEAVVTLFIAACLPLLMVCVAPPLPVAVVLWFASGAATGFLVPLIGTIALMTPPSLRGRAMAVAGAGYNALVAVVYLGAGAIADASKPSAAVVVAGVIGLLVIGAVRVSWPTRQMRQALGRTYAQATSSADPAEQ